MPATVPDLEDEADDHQARTCPTCGEEHACPLAAAECCDPPAAATLPGWHHLFPCPFFHV